MSLSLNIDSILNKTWGNYTPGSKKSSNSGTSGNSTGVDDNIFAKASALVAEYKSKEADSKDSNKKGNSFLGLSSTQIANMSTSDFLKYAYENKANSGFEGSKNDSSGIKLPMLVRYKGQVVCTAGKSFMAVVSKFKAKYPHRSEEEIAAELMSKYGTGDDTKDEKSSKSTSGKSFLKTSIVFNISS